MKFMAFLLAPVMAAAAAANSASNVTETIDVEGTTIVVPAPPGYVTVTPKMKLVHSMQREFVAPMNELFLGFIPAESAADALADQLFDMPRSFTVQTQKRVARQNITAKQFAELKRAITSQNEKTAKQVEKEMPGLMERINQNVTKQTGVKLDLAAPQMVPFPPHEDTERSIAYSMLLRMDAAGADGKKETSHGIVTGTVLLANGKILFLYCNGGEKDLEWSRAISKQWSQSILAANPKGGVEPTSRSGGSFVRSVLRGALIGAAVGAVIGLFRYLSSRRKNKGDGL